MEEGWPIACRPERKKKGVIMLDYRGGAMSDGESEGRRLAGLEREKRGALPRLTKK